jgi:glycosyltransferase involved in cell wall biosynthesis
MTRLGLIARADNSGLGTQTWEFHRHLKPDKTLVIDLSSIADSGDHCNKNVFLERFPGAMVHRGTCPSPDEIESFLDELDVVFTAETFYTYDFLHRANNRGIKTILQYNYEFLAHLNSRDLPSPTVFAAPSLWNYFDTRLPQKIHLPVPIATDRFAPNPTPPETAKVFLHPVGRPAIHDRNGTEDVIAALPLVRSEITMIFRCQRPGHVESLLAQHDILPNVTVVVDTSAPKEYWHSYQGIDAVILPRRYGGLCLPANESLGAHVPVLMPDIDPNNRWLPREWLVPTHRALEFDAFNRITVHHVPPSTLALAIDQFATDSEFYQRAVKEARRLAQVYSWDTLLPQYRSTIDKAMAGVQLHENGINETQRDQAVSSRL